MFKYGVLSGPYFLAFRLNTERYEVSLRIQSECGKIEKTPYLDAFHAVELTKYKNYSCHSQNLINLLTCKNCNIQFVRETELPLHKGNIHRKAKSGCEHMIKHFRNDYAVS